jgi:putative tryptophan/tyrosine transport system substrate-binding protein
VRRRELILGAGVALLGAIAHAQAPRRYRLGILSRGTRDEMFDGALPRILDELGRLGYARGVRLEVFERHGQIDPAVQVGPQSPELEQMNRLARELVAIPVDVILTEGTSQTFAATNATRSIPIVTTVGDPVGFGFARTLKSPGGNVTGVSQNRDAVMKKQFELLRLVRPGITDLAVLHRVHYPALTNAAREAGIRVRELREPEEGFEKKLEKLKAWHINTAFVLDAITPQEAAIAIRHRIALIAQYVPDVETGALMGADSDSSGEYVRYASIIDKIFRGQKPADIPFEQAGRFVTAVNAKTAAALGVRLTPEILLRVDHVFR